MGYTLLCQSFRHHSRVAHCLIWYWKKTNLKYTFNYQNFYNHFTKKYLFEKSHWDLWGNQPQHPNTGVIETVAAAACFVLEHLLAGWNWLQIFASVDFICAPRRFLDFYPLCYFSCLNRVKFQVTVMRDTTFQHSGPRFLCIRLFV